jgi:hypothetical protein
MAELKPQQAYSSLFDFTATKHLDELANWTGYGGTTT